MAELDTISDHADALVRCGDLFRADPVGSNMVAAALVPTVDSTVLRVFDGADTLGVALLMADEVCLTGLGPGAATRVVEALPVDRTLLVTGGAGDAAAVAGGLADRLGGSLAGAQLFRMLRVDTLREPSKRRRGRAFVSERDRLEQAARWATDFGVDTGLLHSSGDRTAEMSAAINEHRLIEWRSRGEVVCQLLITAARFGVVRLSGVYTPPEFRGQGHAAAMVTAVAAQQLERQKVDEVILALHASNVSMARRYRRLGFVGHHEMLHVQVIPDRTA